MTQMDGSMAAKSCGATGAFCLQCFATLDDVLDPAIVEKGFYITWTIEEIQKIYDDLVEEGRMNPETGKHKANSEERTGITMAPLLRGRTKLVVEFQKLAK